MANDFMDQMAKDLSNTPEPENKEGAPQETAPQETPPIPPIVDTPQEPVKEQEVKNEPTETSFDWGKVNQWLGRGEEDGFKDEEGFKTFFDELNGKVGKVSEYEQSLNDMKARGEEYDAVMKYITENEGKYDPLNSVFGGDQDAMKRHFLSEGMKKSGMNDKIISRALDPNLENADSLDVIVVGRQLKSKRLTGKDEAIKNSVLREVGVDFEKAKEEDLSMNDIIKNLSPEQRADLDMEADEVLNEIKSTLSQIDIPETADPIKKILEQNKGQRETAQQLQETWSGKEATQKLTDKLDTLKLEHEGFEFDYKMSEEEKTGILKEIALDAAIKGKELNDENIGQLIASAQRRFIGANASKLFSAAMKQVQLKSKEQMEKDTYNGTPMDAQKEKETKDTPSPWGAAIDKALTGKDIRNM